ncbi:ornithine cyclodeaminase family protein [Microbacterium sp. MPKO10]|uniref:ornithine cyclodeaminase family protein n=1 Tax=Microbacterium sp. MPKO10 TaxID=2989818 RepID=UPI002235CFF3|nr:ornithine cyclodeaminase family protein [Microbacterium sp. MPKO10]MCW4459971.1 ornithine cyclodeaminase family protein [Microbacterium sp. MPKO10]
MMTYVDADTVRATLTPDAAVEAIRDTLLKGFDPADDIPRQLLPIPGGELLVMPSATEQATGIKVLTVGPDDPSRTVPRIQGQYLLFDPDTLSPSMMLDGIALTSLRTPAVSFAPVAPLLAAHTEPLHVVIVGTGAQGVAHEATLRAVLGDRREAEITYVSRTRPDWCERWAETGSDDARVAIAASDLVVCASTAKAPVLKDDWVKQDAVVIALGSHDPAERELPSALMARAQIVVEEVDTAFRSGGDIVMAAGDGSITRADLIPMRAVIRGEHELHRDAPIVVKTTGMSWEDLALATAISNLLGGGNAESDAT